ncbi:hypothetical protein ACU8KH_00732 [Lachancea thermotolerans]|uniref:KLTH0B05632p n=1 Tax=Lachancea thermotolerans (strain ATCC 56472 / CBS 6340 / NRRL Y-8284) TaxID=559295 RepID=C5DCT3_LACTC|nr:KLTH0B05632p [Lachancea thermotolerans CBS 6340]CAR21594.1 KLTH0B05632p [Lachancea thermotolerans CBS 6340]
MQFSTVAFAAASVAVVSAASTVQAISQIGDGQIQATTSAPATEPTTAPTTTASWTSSGNATIPTQTENGAAAMGSGFVAMAGLAAAGALLI